MSWQYYLNESVQWAAMALMFWAHQTNMDATIDLQKREIERLEELLK